MSLSFILGKEGFGGYKLFETKWENIQKWAHGVKDDEFGESRYGF